MQAGIATGIAQTQQISALETAAAGGGGVAQVQPTVEAGQPSNTSGSSVPFVSVSQNTNCRSGPLVNYTLLTTINVGQQVEVLKTFSNDYVLVKNPNGSGDCWLFLQFANTTDFSAFNLAVATQPPTPSPTNTPTPSNTPQPSFDWSGNWVFHLYFLDIPSVNINQSGNSISGSFVRDGDTYNFSGTLSANKLVATGTLEDITHPFQGTFVRQIKTENTNQFVGNLVSGGSIPTTFAFCGSRSDAPMPSPCLLE